MFPFSRTSDVRGSIITSWQDNDLASDPFESHPTYMAKDEHFVIQNTGFNGQQQKMIHLIMLEAFAITYMLSIYYNSID